MSEAMCDIISQSDVWECLVLPSQRRTSQITRCHV